MFESVNFLKSAFRIYEEIQKIEANEFHYQEQVLQTHTHTDMQSVLPYPDKEALMGLV